MLAPPPLHRWPRTLPVPSPGRRPVGARPRLRPGPRTAATWPSSSSRARGSSRWTPRDASPASPDRLLYLHHGRLRSISINGGRPRDIPLSLSYRPARVREHAVVRAGALW
ncbi:hypothetical protein ACFQ07_03790, partial [Actinomadura adrarensis]